MELTVNQKGMIAEAKILAHLQSLGFEVFLPFSDFSPIDMIVCNEHGEVKRLQVKYRSEDGRSKNRIIISMKTVVNGKARPVDRSLIDGYAVYSPDLDKIIYIPISLLPNKSNAFVMNSQVRKTRAKGIIKAMFHPDILFS